MAREAIEYRQIAVPRDISQRWGEATSPETAMATIVRWTQAALDAPDASMRLLLPTTSGNLRVRMSHPPKVEGPRWRGPRAAFVTQKAILRRPRKGPLTLLALPLVCRGECIGVLEVEAAPDAIEGRRDALDAVASQAAILLHDVQHRASPENDFSAERLTELLTLGVALTAHELRGPLSGAKAVIENVLGDPSLNEEHRRKLGNSCQELQYVYELAEEALRWFLGDVAATRDRVDLVQVACDATESCSLEAGEERTVVISNGPVVVRGDHNQLRAALSNIVRNALLYSPSGSKVEITVEASGPDATIVVKDNGPGIQPEEKHAIFEPFFRGCVAGAAPTGKGLGLFLARSAIESHHGSFRVESDESGSAFHISLPATDPERGLWHDL